jgi:hypothetical protein
LYVPAQKARHANALSSLPIKSPGRFYTFTRAFIIGLLVLRAKRQRTA